MPIKKIFAATSPVEIKAGEGEGAEKGPSTFKVTAYNGGALEVNGWDLPVVIDLAGMKFHKSVIANLAHNDEQFVGHVTEKEKTESTVELSGVFSAETSFRDTVVKSAAQGFPFEASVEVTPTAKGVEEVDAGETVTANGQEFTGPIYVARKSTLTGFGFVLRGADPDTVVSIAARAASKKEQKMSDEFKAWVESMGFDATELSKEQIKNLTADFEGREGTRTKIAATASKDSFENKRLEASRRKQIKELAEEACDQALELERYDAVDEIRTARDLAIKGKLSVSDFKYELKLATLMEAPPRIHSSNGREVNSKVLQAAVCQAGGLQNIEKQFSDQELQAAHDNFRDGISLNQLLVIAAQANGYQGTTGGRVTPEVHNFAMGMAGGPRINAGGFSTIDVANVVAATANKFKHEGWMAVDLTPLNIASVRNVRNFQAITTVSLTGHLQYEKLGADGEIKHGVLDDLTYTNQADTYGLMLAITRKDIINDDLSCLTAVPKRLGRGAALKLNDIFWTEFLGLVSANFFAAGNSNINTAVADATIGGLAATETIFMNQTDPDGKPLGIMPKIVLCPTAIKAQFAALLDPQNNNMLITGASATLPNTNVFKGRFRLESSPYISNSSYTGNTAVGWWMLADPAECPVIEIAALNGRVEPTVETAEASFNQLGIQMRGYSDIGVNEQEKRGGVYADGGAS